MDWTSTDDPDEEVPENDESNNHKLKSYKDFALLRAKDMSCSVVPGVCVV
jgi:hypothetical protein